MIKRAKKYDDYSVVSKQVINDPNLTWQAMGLLIYLLSKPDYWVVSTQQLVNSRKAGRDAVRSMLKNLQTAGYVVMQRKQEGGVDWIVYDKPQVIEKQPQTEKPKVGKNHCGEIHPLVINDQNKINTDLLFAQIWQKYGVLKNERRAKIAWFKLGQNEQKAALANVDEFKASLPDWQTIPHLHTYLADRRWEDDLTPPKLKSKRQQSKINLPYDDEQLVPFASKHGLKKPVPGQSYGQYRTQLRAEIEALDRDSAHAESRTGADKPAALARQYD